MFSLTILDHIFPTYIADCLNIFLLFFHLHFCVKKTKNCFLKHSIEKDKLFWASCHFLTGFNPGLFWYILDLFTIHRQLVLT